MQKVRIANYREDGEPGCEVYFAPLGEPKVFDTVAEAAEFLGIDPETLLDLLEGVEVN